MLIGIKSRACNQDGETESEQSCDMVRSHRFATAPCSHTTPRSHFMEERQAMRYIVRVIGSWVGGQRRGVAQRLDASAANRDLCIYRAGLCYDTHHRAVDAEPFLSSPDYSPTQKSTKESTFVVMLPLSATASQDHSTPKTSASDGPGPAQIGLMVASKHNASRQPPWTYTKLCPLSPRRAHRSFTGPTGANVRMPTKSNCAAKPTPPGTTRVTKS